MHVTLITRPVHFDHPIRYNDEVTPCKQFSILFLLLWVEKSKTTAKINNSEIWWHDTMKGYSYHNKYLPVGSVSGSSSLSSSLGAQVLWPFRTLLLHKGLMYIASNLPWLTQILTEGKVKIECESVDRNNYETFWKCIPASEMSPSISVFIKNNNNQKKPP